MKTFHLLNMPANLEKLMAWLAAMLMGLHLDELVAELATVHGTPKQPTTLESLIETALMEEVMQRGLGALAPPQIQTLLTQPQLLLELQEQILLGESPFWAAVMGNCPDSQEIKRRVADGWNRLTAKLDGAK